MRIRRSHLLLFTILAASASLAAAESYPHNSLRLERRVKRAPALPAETGFVRRLFGAGGQNSDSDDANSSTSNGSSSNSDTDSKDSSTSSPSSTNGGLSTVPTGKSSTTPGDSASLSSVSQAASSSAAQGASSSAAGAASSSQADASKSSAQQASSDAAAASSLATSTDAAGQTTVVTSVVPASTDAAASASSTGSSEDNSSGSHTTLIIAVSVVGGAILIGGLIFLGAKFYGKRSGFDDSDADIKWPELKHGGDDAAMQPLPARRTGGAGFDMGDEGSDAGHMMSTASAAPDYSPPLGGDTHSMSDVGPYGAKLSHHDSYAGSSTHLTGPGGAPYLSGQEYHGYYDPYSNGGGHSDINYGQQAYSDQDPMGHHDGGDMGRPSYMDDGAHHGYDGGGAGGYGAHGANGAEQFSNPYHH